MGVRFFDLPKSITSFMQGWKCCAMELTGSHVLRTTRLKTTVEINAIGQLNPQISLSVAKAELEINVGIISV